MSSPDFSERRKVAPWFRLDADFLCDDRIIELGEAHGPAGPMVFIALMGAAKLQDERGIVKFGWRSLARACFLPGPDVAPQIVGACEDAGLLIVKTITDRGFTAEIVKWDLYQRPMALTSTERSRRHRGEKRDETPPDATPGDGPPLHPSPRGRGDDTVDSRQQTVVPPQQQVAPVAAALHPAFADVMAIAQEAAGKDSSLQPPQDFAIERTLRAYPDADHLRAANLAASDLLSGRRTTRHFEKVLADQLADQAKAPTVVDRRSERDKRGAEDLAALRSLRGTPHVD